MRAGAGFNATAVAAAAAPVVTGGGDHLTWHSPVPYLFGGLAAMLGLIALALLILACSYWKLSGYLEGGEDTGSGVELYVKPVAAPTVYEEKVVVIMAGDAKPTFLATPMSTRASSYGDRSSQNDDDDDDHDAKKKEETGNETMTKTKDQTQSHRENQDAQV
ncbi:protein GLUTAMINE DUMPER 3-like [Musa acuminata AAA Group]|uniref:protein GLUTAMINE DUMPER 3-like n=1 Tax=Musa acuminata AAA Group TaxID=214697 RepID=UPI0031CFDC5B